MCLGLALLATGCATGSGPGRTPAGSPAALAGLTVETPEGPRQVEALLAAAPATVFVFWSAGCPCVRRYQARVDALLTAWAGRAAFVGVSSNADESLASVQKEAAARGVQLPLVRDEGGALARALDARSTPTVVLVRADGTVLYRGWIDNERLPGESGREPWLENALDGFTTGHPFSARSPVFGCTITRSLQSTAECHTPPVPSSGHGEGP